MIFHMYQSHDAEKRRGWVVSTHPLVARGFKSLILNENGKPTDALPTLSAINKKLRYREEHSASVVLSWRIHYDISREKIY